MQHDGTDVCGLKGHCRDEVHWQVNGIIGKWEPEGLGRPRFRVPDLFPCTRGGLNVGGPH
jgi:hypothetical protein